MRMFSIVISNLIVRPWNTFLSLLLLTFGIGIISLILQVERQVQQQVTQNIRGIDLVVGAKGSPLQLILSAVYQMDAPVGNISGKEAQKISKNRLVEFGIPLSFGDSYRGYRIVGSDHRYPELYSANLAQGKLWSEAFEVTVGAQVAEKLGLEINDVFHGSHGLVDNESVHEEHAYKVVGIFDPTGSVIDRVILTSTKSVSELHEHGNENSEEKHEHDHEDEPHHEHEHMEDDHEITAMLIGFRSPLALIQLPRMINEDTNMQAAVPAFEIDRLFGFLGLSFEIINGIAISVILISGLSIFIGLYNTLKERKKELAFMRVFGATRWQLLIVVLLEGMVLSLAGFVLGFLMSRIGLTSISNLVEASYKYTLNDFGWSTKETWLLLSTLMIGIVSSILPAIQAYQLNISTTLADD